MSIQQLEAIWTEQPTRKLRQSLARQKRHLRRSILRTWRNIIATIRRQYYLTTALADSRQAWRQNEDIILANIIIVTVLSFSASTILINTIYQFMLAATALSTVFGASLMPLIVLAVGVVSVSLLWLLALLQNLISISLIEGSTRKQKRSLRLTFRRSLLYASRTTISWIGLLTAAFLPAGVLLLAVAASVLLIKPAHTVSFVALGSFGLAGLAWITYVLANYSLLPYVMLFHTPSNWRQAIANSRQLVKNKGRLFLISSYLGLAILLCILGELTRLIQTIPNSNGIAIFSFLAVFALVFHNTCLTMLYRKRRLARK